MEQPLSIKLLLAGKSQALQYLYSVRLRLGIRLFTLPMQGCSSFMEPEYNQMLKIPVSRDQHGFFIIRLSLIIHRNFELVELTCNGVLLDLEDIHRNLFSTYLIFDFS